MDTTTPPEETAEDSGAPIAVIPARQSGNTADATTPPVAVTLIPPLGLDKVVKLTDGFKEWWGKHGANAKTAIIDAIAIVVEVLKPTHPPSPPAQPAPPTP